MKPVIALVGRPNVGKSTLFNRLTRSRDALVADLPGLTRDRRYGDGRVGGWPYLLVDTGGLSGAPGTLDAAMAGQTRLAVREADLVVFLVDGRDGLVPLDRDVADLLRREARRVVLCVNKVDGIGEERAQLEFHELGFEHVVPIAAAHNRGVQGLVDAIADALGVPPEAREETPPARRRRRRERGGADGDDAPASGTGEASGGAEETGAADEAGGTAGSDGTEGPTGVASDADGVEGVGVAERAADAEDVDGERASADPEASPRDAGVGRAPPAVASIAFVGRPNVGKSTLINRLVGEERLVAYDKPGTTRDAIEVPFSRAGRDYRLVDTAGVRRRGRISEKVEVFSVIKTLQAIDRCEVCVMLLDATEGVTEQDLSLLGHVIDKGRALVVAVNKWDAVDAERREALREELERRVEFLRFTRVHLISALHGSGVGELFKSINRAHASAFVDLSTPRLTRLLEAVVADHPPPVAAGRRIKLRYAHQGGQNPPVIIIHGNQADKVPANYRRFLVNHFIRVLRLFGTPLRIEFRRGENPFAGRGGGRGGRRDGARAGKGRRPGAGASRRGR